MYRAGPLHRTQREPEARKNTLRSVIEGIAAVTVTLVVFGLILLFLYYYGTSILAFVLPFILLFLVVIGVTGVATLVSESEHVKGDFSNFCAYFSTVIVVIFISAFIAGLAARVAVFAYSNADVIADRSFHAFSWLFSFFSFMSGNNQTNNVSTEVL